MTDNSERETCGHTATSTGKPCGRHAGWGTDHVGSGYCVDHDETTPPRSARLTKSLQEGIAGLLEQGHSIRAACGSFSLSRERYYSWMETGREYAEAGEENEYTEFYKRMELARATGQRQTLESMLDMARERSDWRAFLEVLKRQYPDDWGDSIDVGPQGKIVFFDYAESDTSGGERVNLDETSPDAASN